jgi:hypothetical protein
MRVFEMAAYLNDASSQPVPLNAFISEANAFAAEVGRSFCDPKRNSQASDDHNKY